MPKILTAIFSPFHWWLDTQNFANLWKSQQKKNQNTNIDWKQSSKDLDWKLVQLDAFECFELFLVALYQRVSL